MFAVMSDAAAKALGFFCQCMDSENQWRKAVDILRGLGERERAHTWIIIASRKPELSAVELSKHKVAFKRALREAEECRDGTEVGMYQQIYTVPSGVENEFVQKTLERSIALCRVFNATLDEIANARKLVRESMSAASPDDIAKLRERLISTDNISGSFDSSESSPTPSAQAGGILNSQQEYVEKLQEAVEKLAAELPATLDNKMASLKAELNASIENAEKTMVQETQKKLEDNSRFIEQKIGLWDIDLKTIQRSICGDILSPDAPSVQKLVELLKAFLDQEKSKEFTSSCMDKMSAELKTAIDTASQTTADRLSSALAAATSESQTLQKEAVDGFGKKVDETQKEIKNLRDAIDKLELCKNLDTLGRLTAELTQIKEIVVLFKSGLNAHFNPEEMNQKLEKIESMIARQSEHIREAVLETEFKKSVDELNGKIDVCTANIANSNKENAQLIAESSKLNLDVYETHKKKLDKTIDDKMKATNEEFTKNTQRLDAQNLKIETMEQELTEHLKKEVNSNSKYIEIRAELSKKMDKDGIETIKQNIKADLESDSNINQIKTQISQLQQDIRKIEDTETENSKELKSLKASDGSHYVNINEFRKQIAELKNLTERFSSENEASSLPHPSPAATGTSNSGAAGRGRQISKFETKSAEQMREEASLRVPSHIVRINPTKKTGKFEQSNMENALRQRSASSTPRSRSPTLTHWRPSSAHPDDLHLKLNSEHAPDDPAPSSSGIPRPTTMLEYLSRQFGQ